MPAYGISEWSLDADLKWLANPARVDEHRA